MRPIHASFAALLLAAPALLVAPASRAATRPVDRFLAVVVSPDGQHVATVERRGDAPAALVVRDRAGHADEIRIACPDGGSCVPASPVWTGPDRLAFLASDDAGIGRSEIEQDDAAGGQASVLARFDGPLAELRVGPDGALAVLATANAHKRPGATAAASRPSGVVGTAVDEQRIARVEANGLRFVSPPGFYVYHYDWLPNGRGFVGVAAPGDGDSQWWVASLHRFDDQAGGDTVLFRPSGREQLADPVVAPDGRSVSFIGGWMSDEGSTGGDVYRLALDRADAVPADLMAGSDATATSIARGCAADGVVAALLDGPRLRIVRLDGADRATTLWSGLSRLRAGGWNDGIACGGGWSAAASEDFTRPPELVAGPIGRWAPISRENGGASLAASVRSLDWTVDGTAVQGWLLTPTGNAAHAEAAAGLRPLVVDVHGGPQAAAEPEWAGDTLAGALLRRGFAVVMPNYRGSFGGGERFAQGSIGDIGGGDWRDVLGSVDAAEHAGAIDDRRVGIVGGSYGGYMAMWAVSQTHRFAAAVAEAGVSDWLSIEGEAPQAGSDPISFGANVYDDPRPYLRASPVMHIKGATTPTLITVGDRDVECPEPQSEEFATALAALGVPHEFVVYPGEGHGFSDPADRADERRRAMGWFVRWLGGGGPGAGLSGRDQ